jgi:hypothetical protein
MIKHECGVFGIYDHEDAARLAYFALYAQQHRGQESAGIVTCDAAGVHEHKGMGLVPDVFAEADLQALTGASPWAMCAIPPPGAPSALTPSLFWCATKATTWPWPTTATWSTPASCAKTWKTKGHLFHGQRYGSVHAPSGAGPAPQRYARSH